MFAAEFSASSGSVNIEPAYLICDLESIKKNRAVTRSFEIRADLLSFFIRCSLIAEEENGNRPRSAVRCDYRTYIANSDLLHVLES